MRQLFLMMATCFTFSNGFGTMLIQGRSDTIKALRDIVRRTSQSVLDQKISQNSWYSSSSTSSKPIIELNPSGMNQGNIEAQLNEIRRLNKFRKNVKFIHRLNRGRRHINNVVVESGQCDHVELVDCSDFETDEMTCMITATGMTCCVCTGVLRQAKRTLF